MAKVSPTYYRIGKAPEEVKKGVQLKMALTEQPVIEKKEPAKVEKKAEKKVERDYGRIVVYTCVTGGYDKLITPVKTPGVDYICFTDNMDIPAAGWELRPLPDGLDGLSTVKKQRMVKILPHKYLPDYDISIWVDGNIEVKADMKEFLNSIIYTGYSVFIPAHPVRKCIYKESDAVKKLKKDTSDMPDKQMKKYKDEGFPENYGLVQSNIMVRWHNDEDCIKVMEVWADEVRKLSHRDQLSFNYALWKTKSTCFKALDKKTCNSKYFIWKVGHGNRAKSKKK